jgi:hypothetical protein
MKEEIEFINGFVSWYETFYEVVDRISWIDHECTYSKYPTLENVIETQGRGGLYTLAYELTQNFENYYQGRVWDGDYFETIDEFLEKELK